MFPVKKDQPGDLQDTDHSIAKRLKRALRRPAKTAPAPESLRGWANSARRQRSKT
jgi:hypothetical protein